MEEQDEEIFRLIKDQSDYNYAFRLIIKSYKDKVYWQVRRMVLNHFDADDITQNIFVKIFKNIEKYKGKAKLSTWIYRISYNETLTFIQSEKRKKHFSDEKYINYKISSLKADEFYSGDEIETLLQKALLELPEKQRLVFELKYYQDLKYDEISNILDTSVGGLKANYYHAVKKIENYIKNTV